MRSHAYLVNLLKLDVTSRYNLRFLKISDEKAFNFYPSAGCINITCLE
jgi:hypothetical protein